MVQDSIQAPCITSLISSLFPDSQLQNRYIFVLICHPVWRNIQESAAKAVKVAQTLMRRGENYVGKRLMVMDMPEKRRKGCMDNINHYVIET